jgi:hypothetical protein
MYFFDTARVLQPCWARTLRVTLFSGSRQNFPFQAMACRSLCVKAQHLWPAISGLMHGKIFVSKDKVNPLDKMRLRG